MKSSDLVLFRDICDECNPKLYNTLQNPDDDFKEDIENGNYFKYLPKDSVEYDFEDMETKLDVSLRYYQRLAVYFTKYYFDKKYLFKGNEDNKLTYWMATGSGKTVIMKANIIDYLEYLRDKNPQEIEIIITSPLKELIGQLRHEMSEFFTHEFFRDFKITYKIETTQGLISSYENKSYEIIGDNIYRLLLVDEAHIGLGTKEKGAFVNIRDELTKNKTNSFMFEYSATFYDIKNKSQIEDYAQRIVFEYDYGKFYNDKYGKDFKFDVIKKDEIAEDENKDIKRNLDLNMKEFNNKINAFNEYNSGNKHKQFQNRPLLIMAGNTVSASSEKKSNNEENSDIAKIIDYFAHYKEVNEYLNIFNESNGVLHLLQNSSSLGEILLSYGEDSKPFGLITVGDVKKFLENSNIQKLINDGVIISKTIKFADENYLFKNIDYNSSSINILIGSRKFSAGWNSFRASQICLINFGTGSGPTIIQMFGRGVRLRGLNNDGKRQELYYVDEKDGTKSNFLPCTKENKLNKDKYKFLKYLETLFIYSLRSTYLSKFVEEDTDIYKKSITFTKDVVVEENHKEKELPIFYVDKTFEVIQHNINCNLDKNKNNFVISYEIESKENTTKIELPFVLDFSIENEKSIKFEDIKILLNFIDKPYLEKLLLKKMQQNNILIESFSINYIFELIENKSIIIKYDGILNTPIQIQKILLKIINTLVPKIKNKIQYNENKQKYKFDQTISDDDYISQYELKFTLEQNGDAKNIRERLEKDKTYKVFVDKILNHYYTPLAIDPEADTRLVYKTFEKCISKNITENMHSVKDSDDKYFSDIESIKVSPDKLDPNEFKFICDMQEYINKNKLNATILRNKSNGNIGLISDEGVFYPDFIIWYMDNKKQEHILLCDPKGIRNAETKWKVCEAPYQIKDIESQWNNNIKLHSFIISNTKIKDVVWEPIKNLDNEQCDKFFNLVFMEDENYIEKIFKGINQDILLHKYFQKYITYYDENIKKEWIDDLKRAKHILNINTIKDTNNIEMPEAILLYFTIYSKKDMLKEDILNSVKDETKEYLLNEIIPEAINAFIPGAKIGIKTIKLIVEKFDL